MSWFSKAAYHKVNLSHAEARWGFRDLASQTFNAGVTPFTHPAHSALPTPCTFSRCTADSLCTPPCVAQVMMINAEAYCASAFLRRLLEVARFHAHVAPLWALSGNQPIAEIAGAADTHHVANKYNCRDERMWEVGRHVRFSEQLTAALRKRNGGREPSRLEVRYAELALRWSECAIVHSKSFQNLFVATRSKRIPAGCLPAVRRLISVNATSGGRMDRKTVHRKEEKLSGLLRTKRAQSSQANQ